MAGGVHMTNDARALLPDITGRADVHDLVVDFYREVVFDDVLSPVFGEVAEVDWAEHIPKLIDSWCSVLFGDPGYRGAILRPHQRINELERFESAMFDRWYELWSMSLDRRWNGPTADRARSHAARIADVLSRRLTGVDWSPSDLPSDVVVLGEGR